MNETNWEIISAISAISVISVIIGVCLVVRFARSKSSNASVENYHYEKFLERYRSMDDLELDEVFARQLRDKFADSDSVAAIRQVMSERSRGSTPAEKFKSWQEPLVTENNKQHIQAKEEKAAQPEMDDDAPESGSETNVVIIKVPHKQQRLLLNFALFGFFAFQGIVAYEKYKLNQSIEEYVIAHYAEHYPGTKIQIRDSTTYHIHGDVHECTVDLRLDGEAEQVTVKVLRSVNIFRQNNHFQIKPAIQW